MTHHPSNPDATLATRARELEAVCAIGVEIAREMELAEVLRLISERLSGLVGYGRGGVCIWDDAAQLLIPHTKLNQLERERFGLQLGQGVAGKVAESLQGVIVNDYRTRPGVPPELLAQTKVTAMMAEPLLYRDRLVGVIHMDTGEAGIAFTEHDHELLRLVAPQAAIAIENARLHEATARRAAQLANLTELTQMVTAVLEPAALAQQILDAAQVLIPGVAGRLWEAEAGSDALRLVASIGLQEPAGGVRIRFRQGEGITGLAVATRHPVICADVTGDPRFVNKAWAQAEGLASSIVLPLVHRDQALGVLSLFTRSPHVFTPDEVRLLSAFAAQAAIAMANARLYAAASGQRRQLEAVQAVTTEITRELEVTRVLDLILDRAMGLLDTRSGAIFLWDEAAQVLVPQAHIGLGAWYGDVRHPLGEGVVGAVAQRRAGLIVNDYPTSPYVVKDLQHRTGVQRAICAPLLYRDRLIGVLILRDKQSGAPFQEADLALLCLFADQAAIAIKNARLYTATQQELAERKAAEEALRESEERFKLSMEATSDGLWDWNVKTDGGYFSPGYYRMLGYEVGAFPAEGNAWMDLIHPDDHEHALQANMDCIEGRRDLFEVEYRMKARNGEWRWILGRGKCIGRDGQGRAVRLVGTHVDITERKRAEVALRDRTAQLEAVRAVSAEFIRELDLDRLLTLLTQRVTKLLGVPTATVRLWEEASGLLIPMGWTSEVSSEIARLPFRLGEGVAGAAAQRRMGLLVNDFRTSPYATPALLAAPHTAALAEPLLYHDRLVGVLSVDNGTTGRPFTPDDQVLLRLFADHAAIAIENARLHTAAVRKGEELGALLRAAQALMTGLNLQQTLEAIASEAARIARCDHVKLLLVDREARVLRVGVYRGRTTPEGFPLPIGTGLSGTVAQTGHPLYIADTQNDPRSALAAFDRSVGLRTYLGLPITIRGEVLGVLTFNTPEPYEYTPEEITYFTAFADQAAIAIKNARLFTEATQSLQDLRKAQDTLVQTEKLRALGQMAGGIAHDLNNKLMVILGQAELLRLTVPDPVLEQELTPLEEAATASAAVVRQILDFARQQPGGAPTPLALAAMVEEALARTRAQWKDTAERQGASITIHTALADLPPVLGQAAELREALVQVIGNAVEAMPTGGTLTIAGRVPAPGWVELTVTDTGVGIPAELQPRIFDPFFTTKGVQRTGLGLAVVYGTVQRHGGTISVVSTPARGTTVTLRLPAAGAVQAAAPPAPGPARAGITPRRLLLIDDEPKVRGTLASLLRAVGHTVTEAASGPAGLALLATTPVDCVLTDLGMPEMTGWEVATAVTASWPHLPVLLLTGWGDQAVEDARASTVARVLCKPIRREDLLAVIAEVTGGR